VTTAEIPATADALREDVVAHPLAAWVERTFGITDQDGLLIRHPPVGFEAAVDHLARRQRS